MGPVRSPAIWCGSRFIAAKARETQYDTHGVMYYGYVGYVEGKADRTRL